MPKEETLLSEYDERQQIVINNLIRKSLITKINSNGTIAIKKNIQG